MVRYIRVHTVWSGIAIFVYFLVVAAVVVVAAEREHGSWSLVLVLILASIQSGSSLTPYLAWVGVLFTFFTFTLRSGYDNEILLNQSTLVILIEVGMDLNIHETQSIISSALGSAGEGVLLSLSGRRRGVSWRRVFCMG